MLIQFLVLMTLLALSALFSGVETAFMSINKVKVKALLKEGKKGTEALFRIKQNPHRLLITILIFNNLVNIFAASLSTVVFTDLLGSTGLGVSVGVITLLVLIFGEITPKTFALQNSERISLLFARPIEILSYMIYPVALVLETTSKITSKVLGSKNQDEISEEELRTIVSMGAEEGVLSEEAAEMMQNVLEFKGTKVVEVMTPEVDMQRIDGDKQLKEVIDFVVKTPFSRYPVYEGDEDNIVGVLDVDDVLKYTKERKLNVKVKKIAKEVVFIPETKSIDDLLSDFEKNKMIMAIVVDEYGNVSGLVTVDDILEEIVGDIFDKSQRQSLLIKKIDNKTFRVDAKTPIKEVNKVLRINLQGGNFYTIAGYVQHKLQKIPKKGEKIKLKNSTIEVEKVTKQGIKSVKVTK